MSLYFLCGFSQEKKAQEFSSPFKIPLLLSGNFAEIRSTHLHAGVDFKTNGAVNVPIYAIADGYIAKARVTNGSGLILEVCYDNKYYTISRHLHRFLPKIEQMIENKQYAKKNHQVEIAFKPKDFPVKAGELIGYSGNTGYSFGPHLHLEVMDNTTREYLDPLSFFAKSVKDNIPPKVEGFMIMPKYGYGAVNGDSLRVFLPASSNDTAKVWGKIAFGVLAHDYMEGSTNKFGVYRLSLKLDGNLLFTSLMDSFFSYESNFVNSWTSDGYMKSYVEEGNKMRQLKTYNGNRGWVDISEEREYMLEYEMSDIFGNTTVKKFVVRGEKQYIAKVDIGGKQYVRWNEDKNIVEKGAKLFIPKKSILEDTQLFVTVDTAYNDIAGKYSLNTYNLKLVRPATLKIKVNKQQNISNSKYYIAVLGNNGKLSSVGGHLVGDTISANIKSPATYVVAIDNEKPVITPYGKKNWAKNNEIVFHITDKNSSIAACKATIDGQFAVIWRPNSIKPYWHCKLDAKRFKKGIDHKVKIVATDDRGNTSVVNTSFMW